VLAVTILGNNSAVPAFDRHPSAQVITMDEHLFLVDCGEGTQMQMSKYKIRRSKINHIFISHLHGDHYFGLAGLITSMGLLGRIHDLHLYAPKEMQDIFDLQFRVADTKLPYNLIFHHLLEEGVIARDPRFEVTCFRVHHRIDCWGFKFNQIKPTRKVLPDKARQFDIPASFFDRLKWGEDYLNQGETIKNEWVTEAAVRGKSYAYSADTLYHEDLIEKIQGVDLLYHEATYLKDLEDRAVKRFHSTTVQAATIAKKAAVGRLLIGHFSSKYEKLDEFQREAGEIFPNAELALEGVTYRV
jgi:ribonuclease Z